MVVWLLCDVSPAIRFCHDKRYKSARVVAMGRDTIRDAILPCGQKPVAEWWLGSRVVSVLHSGAEGLGSNRSRDAVG